MNVLLERFFVHIVRDNSGTAIRGGGYVELFAASPTDALNRALAEWAWPVGSMLGVSRTPTTETITTWTPARAALSAGQEQ